jgi:hypothetical protein
MKTIIYKRLCTTLFVLPLFVGMISCSDNWLKPEPLSFYAPENVLITKPGLESSLVTSRSLMRAEFIGNNCYIATELMTSDVAVGAMIGSSSLKNWTIQLMPDSYGDTQIRTFWTVGYNAIKCANTVISNVPLATSVSENDRNTILAEGYFHRAYWYYRLVHQFGDVPFIDGEVTSPKLDFYSHTRKSILLRLKKDLEFATKYLPETVLYGAVNKAAAYHLLSKVCLAVCDFDGAIAATTAVISDPNYALMGKRFGVKASDSKYNVVSDLFIRENIAIAGNKELILVVQDIYGMTGNTTGSKRMRDFVPAWWAANAILDPAGTRGCIDGVKGQPQLGQIGRGIGRIRTTNYFNYEIWDSPSDYRHSSPNWINMEDLIYNNPASKYFGKPLQKKFCLDTIYAWSPMQHYKIFVPEDSKPDVPDGGYTNWYVFRLGETYLLRAEAYYWKSNLGLAMADINMVRKRANATQLTDESKVTLDYILDERARELFIEEPRKTELTRMAFIMAELGKDGYSPDNMDKKNYYYDRMMEKNIFFKNKIFHAVNIYNILPYHYLWPIPENTISSNSQGRINQNLGYPGAEKNVPPLEVK